MPDAPFWQKCNSHCTMCTNSDAYIDEPDAKYSLEKHREKIAEYIARPGDRTIYYRNGEHGGYFLFTGGEPTLNPEFFRLLAEYRAAFPDFPMTLLTNGRLFCDEAFARNTLVLGGAPLDLCVPVHGPDAKTHDSVTRAPGSFVETVAGLKHLLKHRRAGQGLEVRVILHRHPSEWLAETLAFLLSEFPDTAAYRLTLVYFESEGQATKNLEHIKISLSDCAARVAAAAALIARFSEARLYHFPLCVLPPGLWPLAWRALPSYEIRHVSACRTCAMNDLCAGPHDWYPGVFGEGEFAAFALRRHVTETGNPFHPIAEVHQESLPWRPTPPADAVRDPSARW
ncbi:MAG: radical SAM protein [Elusimicrobia bacterium]|nr:radical SAM protein [Elusimicrobiota bacterium]